MKRQSLSQIVEAAHEECVSNECYICTWCGYKIIGLILEHFYFKKLHNRNVVTLNVLTSPIPKPLHANLPLLKAMLQVVF
jgi:hypothetical protein